MSRVNTWSRIAAYEINGEGMPPTGEEYPELIVESHWNRGEMVVLSLGDGRKITVAANDLLLAIRRATG